MAVVLALAALAVSSGAARADRGSPVADSCPKAPEVRYFPVGRLWPGLPDIDVFVRQWYSKHLTAMEEPSLSCGALEDSEAYRFLWLRTFHNPVAVRVFQRDGDYGLEAVILDGAGGYDPGHVSRRVTRTLSRDQWRSVIAKLEGMQFWQMATKGDDLPGCDGAQWIVEARRGGRYHIVDRWTGTDHGLESVGRLFLDLAGPGNVGTVY
jgi:hypothetical protein